jgi:hypothetical protein
MVIDDRNMPGKTLGARRLQTDIKSLYRLKKALLDRVSLIRRPGGAYIDNNGKYFYYKKTLFCQVRYLKILRAELRDTYTLLWFFNLNQPWEVPRPPPQGYPYAGIIFLYGSAWELYEYSQIDRGTLRRKI